jgi:pimeloyl-ACP methyl ester carboxylesterase
VGSAIISSSREAPMSTFVLVHGAWGGAWCWFKVIPLLQKGGHRVIALDLPSHGIDKRSTASVSLEAYVERVGEVLDACNEPVVLVGHSMGGIVISRAAELKPAKVAKLVYVAAFLLQDGQTLMETVQADTQGQALPNIVLSEDQKSATVKEEALRPVFGADCTDADLALAGTLLVPQAVEPFTSPVRTSAGNWGTIPRIYIECVQDNAISIAMQRAMYAALPCQRVITMETSHMPMLAAPEALADHLLRL